MAYNILLSNGQPLTVIQDNTVDTSHSSLALIGHNYSNYGQFVDDNFVHVLENFSNSTPPTSPLEGQLWWDNVNLVLNVFNGSAWVAASRATTSPTSPLSLIVGDMWWNSLLSQLNVWNGASWIMIGPTDTLFSNATVLDTNSVTHNVTKLFAANILVAIVSSDHPFTITTIPGFSQINPGINLITSSGSSGIQGIQLTGTASNATSLGSIPAANYLRSDITNTAVGDLYISNYSGHSLTIGEANELVIGVTPTQTNILGDNNVNFLFGPSETNVMAVTSGGVLLGGNLAATQNYVNSQITVASNNYLMVSGANLLRGNIVPDVPNNRYLGASLSPFSNVYSDTFTGQNLIATNIFGALATNAQPYINSIGPLVNLTVTGGIQVGPTSSFLLETSPSTTEQLISSNAPGYGMQLITTDASSIQRAGLTIDQNGHAYVLSDPLTPTGIATKNYVDMLNTFVNSNFLLTNGINPVTGTIAPIANYTYDLGTTSSAFRTLYAQNLSGVITTTSQPNITSVGTLSSLSVLGNISGANANIVGTINSAGLMTNAATIASGLTVDGATFLNATTIYGALNSGAITAPSIAVSGVISGGSLTTPTANIPNLTSTNATLTNITAGTLTTNSATVAGSLQAQTLTVAGITASSINTSTIQASGAAAVNSLSVNGAITSASLSTQSVNTGKISATSQITAPSANISNLTSTNANVTNVAASQLSTNSATVAGSLQAQTLTVAGITASSIDTSTIQASGAAVVNSLASNGAITATSLTTQAVSTGTINAAIQLTTPTVVTDSLTVVNGITAPTLNITASTTLTGNTVITSANINSLASQTANFSNLTATISALSDSLGNIVRDFDSDVNLASDSNNRLPTQAAVKAYIDSAISNVLNTLSTDMARVTAGLTPTGIITWFAAQNPPVGFLVCNGQNYSIQQYPNLYAVIGTTYGGVPGVSFSVPDLRAYFIRGWDDGRGVDYGRSFGTTQVDVFGQHSHVFPGDDQLAAANGLDGWVDNPVGPFNYDAQSSLNGAGKMYQTALTGDVETRPKNMALLPIIKY